MGAQADVLVVGGGPAGSTAALLLARGGMRVRVLDRSAFPRDKLCGDTLNPGALALLDDLGVGRAVRDVALPTKGMMVTGPRGETVVGDYGVLRGAAIRRRDLDRQLLEAAASAGAIIEEQVEVRSALIEDGRVVGVRTASGSSGCDVRARLVLAADGRQSRLASQLGLSRFARTPKRWAFGAYFAGVDGLGEYGEMHVRGGAYIGVAPLPGQLANVCVVKSLEGERLQATSGDVIRDAIDADIVLRDRFARAERVSPVTVLGPLAVESTRAGVPGLLLAGDAAGFVDPMTGDGLRFAIRGAQLAALAAVDEMTTGVPACDALFEARRREFAAKWRINRGLRALVSSPRGVRLASAVGSRWGAPVRTLIAVAGDVAVARRLRASQPLV